MPGFAGRLERLELKYLIDESTAAKIVRDIEPYCAPDPHNLDFDPAKGASRPGYEIRSLYLDTPSLAFHHAKERGDPERLKLRFRGYEAGPYAVMECKQRSRDIIFKRRARISAEDLEAASRGDAKLEPETAETRAFADRVAALVMASGAEPSMIVRYRREAYESLLDGYARVTFDRDLSFQRTKAWDLRGSPDRWDELVDHVAPTAPNPLVVLELKCETAIPYWIHELIRARSLGRRSFSKYSLGIHLTNWLEGWPISGRSVSGVLTP